MTPLHSQVSISTGGDGHLAPVSQSNSPSFCSTQHLAAIIMTLPG
nr:MAG TPA: hypothetical protein [Caudoviricetes sp.]